MSRSTKKRSSVLIPKRRQKHHSYDESVDEPAKVLAEEPVDIEREAPAEENEPIERVDDIDKPDSSAFEN
jgi:hypothetical protein